MFFFFFFNDTATTEIYTLSLHDALPIFDPRERAPPLALLRGPDRLHPGLGQGLQAAPDHSPPQLRGRLADRKSTRLNSSHSQISYAVFCLKKKKTNKHYHRRNIHTHKMH